MNQGLFHIEPTQRALPRLVDGDLTGIAVAQQDKILYTSAMSYCCATDLLKTDDRKTPATFFEILVGHLIASLYSTNPGKEIQILAQQRTLPTDFVFDLGPDRSKLHVPVKISTRERIIQVWAHQRVLDGVYGINHFRGVLVCLTETNMVRRNLSVVEVCLPDQWAIYQTFIAQMHRIYYFDPPSMYAQLASRYPFIQVRSFSSFFEEGDRLAGPPTS